MKTKISILLFLSLCSFGAFAGGYGPFNQQQTYNYNTGCSNWQSCFSPGINTAGVTLIGGIVNALSRPDPVPVQVQQAPVYVNGGNPGYMNNSAPYYGSERPYSGYGYRMSGRTIGCGPTTVYDQFGNPQTVTVCK